MVKMRQNGTKSITVCINWITPLNKW